MKLNTPVEMQLVPRLAHLEKVAKESPGDLDAALALVQALIAAQDFDAASDEARRALALRGGASHVGQLSYELLYATARKDLRDLALHAREAQKLLKKHAGEAWAHRNMALVYYYTEEDAKARKSLARAFELDSNDAGALEVWAMLAQADGDYEDLIERLTRSLRRRGPRPRLRKVLADAHMDVGGSEEARALYLGAIAEEPLFVDAWHALGSLCLGHDGDYVAALRCFAQALTVNPRCWDVYFTLTDYFVEERRYDLAKAEAMRVLLLDPDSSIKAEVENHLGYVEYIERNYEDAVRRYRRAIALDPEFDSPWHNLGLVHVHEKDYDSAIECFEKAIELNEDRSWSYTQLGLAYFERKNYRKAHTLFLKALEKNPEEYGAHLGLAELYRKEKRYPEQLAECLKALEVEPNDGNVRNYLGIAYECGKRPEEAAKQYVEALRLDPLNRWAANNLGYLYEKLWGTTEDERHRELAIAAWKLRLLICRDTQTSTAGARNHILKLGVSAATFERWLRDGKLETELDSLS